MESRKKIKNIPLKSNKPLRGEPYNPYILDDTWDHDFYSSDFEKKYLDKINKRYSSNIRVRGLVKENKGIYYSLENIPDNVKNILKNKFKKRYSHLKWKIENVREKRLTMLLDILIESNAVDFIKED